MAISAQSIIRRGIEVLQDTTSIRWSVAELCRWLNDAQREIIMYRPDAMVTNTSLACVTGSRQSIAGLNPPGAKLIEVIRNSSGTRRAIRDVNREVLDASSPGWHNATAASEILHFMFDERDPRTFYVYPPAVAATGIDIVYSELPTDVQEPASGAALPIATLTDGASFLATCAGTTLTVTSILNGNLAVGQQVTFSGVTGTNATAVTALGTGSGGVGTYTLNQAQTVASSTIMYASGATVTGFLSVPDVLSNPVIDYVLYRAYMKDSDYAGNGQRAMASYQAFATALGIEIKGTLVVSPNSSSVAARNPNNPQGAGSARQAA